MKQILRAFLFLLLFTATVNTAIADEKANVTKQGTVRGRIIDATKQTLPGASIYIEKLHTGVTSDVNGFYTFSNLDPGTYTVKVSYVGYSPVELKITIPAGRTLEKDVVLNEGVELQEVVVGGAFQGQRRAINSQKNNMGITNVVSADQVASSPTPTSVTPLNASPASTCSTTKARHASGKCGARVPTSAPSPSTATAFPLPKAIRATYSSTSFRQT